jgi:hypothetical protein
MRMELAGNDWRFRSFFDGAWLHERAAAPDVSDAAWIWASCPAACSSECAA